MTERDGVVNGGAFFIANGGREKPFGIGKFVTATGFQNGSERDAKRKDGTPFKSYSVWFTVKTLESAAPDPAPAADEISNDIPF